MITILQAPSQAVIDAATKEELGFSLIDMACKGGWLMIPLILLSFVTIYLFSMKWWAIKKASVLNKDLMDNVKANIAKGNFKGAIELCQQENTPIARMIAKGVTRLGRPLQDIQTAVENVGSIEIASLEKGLPMMATIAGGAPMIGFLGTVMGMVQAFFNMAQAGSNIDITLLSGGIYTAMVTTVAGLIVGIMAYFGYNFLTAKVSNLVTKMEHTTMDFIDMVGEFSFKR